VLESLLHDLKDQFWVKAGDVHLLVANRYDHARSRLEIDYTFVKDGRVETRHGSHRAYSYRELVELVGRSGFVVESSDTWTRQRAINPDAEPAAPGVEPYQTSAQTLLLTLGRP